MDFKNKPTLIFELLLLLPFLAVLIYFDYLPNNDEVFQVEAAIRLSKGLGYTCSWGIPLKLSDLNFKYLTAWPPGYSILISILLYVGINVFTALKFLKAILIFIAISEWDRFAKKKLLGQNARIAFYFLITLFAITISASPTELILLILIGWNLNLSETFLVKNQTKLYLFLFGLSISLGIIFKYSWLGFNAGFLIWGVLKIQKRSFLNLFSLIFPSLFVPFVLFSINFLIANQLNTIVTTDTLLLNNLFAKILAIPYLQVFQSAIFYSIQLPVLFLKVFSYFGVDITIFLSCIFWLVIFKLIIDKFKILNLKKVILNIQMIVFISGFLFFFSISVLFYSNMSEWIPSIEPRYFQPISPLILLFLISSWEQNISKKSIQKWHLGILYVNIFLLQCFYTYSKFRLFSIVDFEREKVSSFITNNSQNNKLLVYTDGNWKNKFVRNGQDNVFEVASPSILNINYPHNTFVVFVFSNIDYSSFKYPKAMINTKLMNSLKLNSFKKVGLSNRTLIFFKTY